MEGRLCKLIAVLALLLSAAMVVLWIESLWFQDIARGPLPQNGCWMLVSDKGKLFAVSIDDPLDRGWSWSRTPTSESDPFDETGRADYAGFQCISTFQAHGVSVPLWFVECACLLCAGCFGCAFLPTNKRWICPNCGHDSKVTVARCPECGHALGKPAWNAS
jgi:hypothetical protein